MKFIVEDMTCGHCKAAIEKAVADAGGNATVDLAAHSVAVEGITPEIAETVIRDAGYTPVKGS